jgi:hypothetical protein
VSCPCHPPEFTGLLGLHLSSLEFMRRQRVSRRELRQDEEGRPLGMWPPSLTTNPEVGGSSPAGRASLASPVEDLPRSPVLRSAASSGERCAIPSTSDAKERDPTLGKGCPASGPARTVAPVRVCEGLAAVTGVVTDTDVPSAQPRHACRPRISKAHLVQSEVADGRQGLVAFVTSHCESGPTWSSVPREPRQRGGEDRA